MGAKTWIIVYSNGDIPSLWQDNLQPKKDSSTEILNSLFPNKKFHAIEKGNLAFTNPGKGKVQIADLGKFLIVATGKVALDHPSKIPQHFINYSNYSHVYVFAMHSVVDWFAFAIWKNKKLVRSLSLSPDSGVMEDIGEPLAFEQDFWSGKHSLKDAEEGEDQYPLPFHPLDFGEAALLNLMGYQYEGYPDLNKVDPETIEMLGFQQQSFWKFW
jgi:hypothetical protein